MSPENQQSLARLLAALRRDGRSQSGLEQTASAFRSAGSNRWLWGVLWFSEVPKLARRH